MAKQKIEFIIPESDIESNKLDLNYDGDPLLDAIKNESDDFNFKEFLTSSGIAYNVIYDMPINRDSIADFIKNLLADTVLIDDYRSILIASFILTPSAIVSTTPILFAYGESGSGKSGIGSIAASLYGVKVFGVLTYAGMRNLIHQKFTNGKREKNFMFVIDDIDAKFLSDPNIFSMLKSGCYRLYERIAIAGKEPGEIIEFFCFCPKLFSSQWNLFNDERFIELNRRFIPIPTFKLGKVPKNELAAINFTGIEKHFSNIWKDREICIEYARKLAIYNTSLPKIADENQIATDQLTILLPQAVTAELFKMCSIKEYFEYIKKSWQLTKNNVASRELDQCCQKIIAKISRNVVIDDIEYIKIRHQQFVDAVTYARKKEITDLKMPEIKKVLLNQGWTFTVDLLDENQCLWLKKIG
jgi:ABC-type oligopeptide transport system ATPase subunit